MNEELLRGPLRLSAAAAAPPVLALAMSGRRPPPLRLSRCFAEDIRPKVRFVRLSRGGPSDTPSPRTADCGSCYSVNGTAEFYEKRPYTLRTWKV